MQLIDVPQWVEDELKYLKSSFCFIIPNQFDLNEKESWSHCKELAAGYILYQLLSPEKRNLGPKKAFVDKNVRCKFFVNFSHYNKNDYLYHLQPAIDLLKTFEKRFPPYGKYIPKNLFKIAKTKYSSLFYFSFSSFYRQKPQLISMVLNIIKFAELASEDRHIVLNLFEHFIKSDYKDLVELFDFSLDDYVDSVYEEFDGFNSGIQNWAIDNDLSIENNKDISIMRIRSILKEANNE